MKPYHRESIEEEIGLKWIQKEYFNKPWVSTVAIDSCVAYIFTQCITLNEWGLTFLHKQFIWVLFSFLKIFFFCLILICDLSEYLNSRNLLGDHFMLISEFLKMNSKDFHNESFFLGIHCETEINECLSSPCLNRATCEDRVGDFHCKCPAGFIGVLCEKNINECLSRPCKNGATCKDGINSYR